MAKQSQAIFSLTSNEYRPCYVMGHTRRGRNAKAIEERRKALFHRWTLEQSPVGAGLTVGSHPGGQLSTVKAVLELEDGHICLVSPQQVRFLDTESMMDQLCWPDDEEVVL